MNNSSRSLRPPQSNSVPTSSTAAGPRPLLGRNLRQRWVEGCWLSLVLRTGGLLLLVSLLSAQETDPTPQVEATWTLSHLQIQAGAEGFIVLRLVIPEGYHIYWRSPGASGMGTFVARTTQDPVDFSPILWPVPQPLEEPELGIVWVYTGTVEVLIPFRVRREVIRDEPLALDVRAEWMVCATNCSTGDSRTRLLLPLGETTQVNPRAPSRTEVVQHMPRPLQSADTIQAHQMPADLKNDPPTWTIRLTSRQMAEPPEILWAAPYGSAGFDTSPALVRRLKTSTDIHVRLLPRSRESAATLSDVGLLVALREGGNTRFIEWSYPSMNRDSEDQNSTRPATSRPASGGDTDG